MIELLRREFVYLWYYFDIQFRQIFPYWVPGMVLGSAVSVFAKDHIHNAFRALGGRRLGAAGIIAASALGMLGAYWCFVLMCLHLGFHWPVMLAPFRRALRGKTALLRAAGAAVSAFGAFAFLRREVGAYLLGQIQFAFFDFEEPLFLFLLDYLAIMGLFVWAGHYLGLLLRRLSPKGE